MADPLFPHGPEPQLPAGTPSLDDDKAWAPYQSPGGLVPDATSFRPRAFDPETLTPDQRHAMRQAIRSGSQAEYQAFLDSLSLTAQQNTASPPSPAGQADGDAGSSVAEGGEVAPERSEFDEGFTAEAVGKFAEFGAHPAQVAAMEPAYNRFYDRIAALPEAEREPAILASEDEMVRQVYRGSEAALKDGLKEIETAARQLGLDIDAINASSALADPATHSRALSLARIVNRNSKGAAR